MAVFLQNNCKFPGCGLCFPTLADLIQHIEDTHIDADPRVVEKQELQQPTALALSYILRFFTDAGKKERLDISRKNARVITPVSFRSATPTGSEFDEEEMVSDDDDSDDSWTAQEEFTSELIMSMMGARDGDGDKPFACPVPGCKKRYKNVNGIKYHARHGHRKDTRVRKAFKCHCGKSYKTSQGLKSHCVVHQSELINLQTAQITLPSTQIGLSSLQVGLSSLSTGSLKCITSVNSSLFPSSQNVTIQSIPVPTLVTTTSKMVIPTVQVNDKSVNITRVNMAEHSIGGGCSVNIASPTTTMQLIGRTAAMVPTMMQLVSQPVIGQPATVVAAENSEQSVSN